jgi:hypothetical protein
LILDLNKRLILANTQKDQADAVVQAATTNVTDVSLAATAADTVRRAAMDTKLDLQNKYLAKSEQENKKILDAALQPLLDQQQQTTAAETLRVAAVEAARAAAQDAETARVAAEVALARQVAFNVEAARYTIEFNANAKHVKALAEVARVAAEVEAVRAAAEVEVASVENVLIMDTQEANSIAVAVKLALDQATATANAAQVAAQAEVARVAAVVDGARLAAETEAARIATEIKSKIPADADAAAVEAARVAAQLVAASVAADIHTTRFAAEVASARVAAEVDTARVAAEVEAKRLEIEHETTRLAVEVVVEYKRLDAEETGIRVAFVANASHHAATLQNLYLVAVETAAVAEAACVAAQVNIALVTADAEAARLAADYTALCIATAADSDFDAAATALTVACLQINIERMKNPGNEATYDKRIQDANRQSHDTSVTVTTEIAAAHLLALKEAARVATFVASKLIAQQNEFNALKTTAKDTENAAQDALQKATKAEADATEARENTIGLAQVQHDKRDRETRAIDVATSAADAAREAADEAVRDADLAAKNVAAEVVRAAAAAADLESIRVSAETAAEDVLVKAAEEEVRLKAVAQEALAKTEAAAAAASAAVASAAAVDTSGLDAEAAKLAADSLRIAKVIEKVDTEMAKQITVLTKAFDKKMRLKGENNRDDIATCTDMNKKNQELHPRLDENIRDDARLAAAHVKCQQELAIMTSNLKALQTISSTAKEEYEDEPCNLHLYTEAAANCKKIGREISGFQGKLEAAQKESENATRSFESTKKRVDDGETRLKTQLTELKKQAATTSGDSELMHTACSEKVTALDKLCKDITLQDDANLYKNTLQYRIAVAEEEFAKAAHDKDTRHVDTIAQYESSIIKAMDETRKIRNANVFDKRTAATDEELRFKKYLEREEEAFADSAKKTISANETKAESARRFVEHQKKEMKVHEDLLDEIFNQHPSDKPLQDTGSRTDKKDMDRIAAKKTQVQKEDEEYKELEENTRRAKAELQKCQDAHGKALSHTSEIKNAENPQQKDIDEAEFAEKATREAHERARKAYFDAFSSQIASPTGRRLSHAKQIADKDRRHHTLSPNSEPDSDKVHAAFVSSILSLARTLVERVYPPTPTDPARTRQAFARHARADPRIAASVAHGGLHALCARIAHIAELADTLPSVAALRFVLEIPENSRLVERATAPRPSGSPYAARAVQAPDHKNIAAIRECLHKTKLQHVRRNAEAFLTIDLQHTPEVGDFEEISDEERMQWAKQQFGEHV